MAKLIVGFVFAAVFAVLAVMLVRELIRLAGKSHKENETLATIKDAIFYLKGLQGNPLYAALEAQTNAFVDRLTHILHIAEKNPGYIPALKDLEGFVLPTVKKLYCDFETYTQASGQSPRAQKGLETVIKGLDNTADILNRMADALMENMTLDVEAEMTALREMYDTRENG
jgi:hypothetical protein